MSPSETNFGVQGSQPHTPIEVDEHAIVDSVHAKKTFPIELNPLAQTNPSYVLSYNANGYCVKIEETIGSTTYTTAIVPQDSITTVATTKTISVWT